MRFELQYRNVISAKDCVQLSNDIFDTLFVKMFLSIIYENVENMPV